MRAAGRALLDGGTRHDVKDSRGCDSAADSVEHAMCLTGTGQQPD